MSQERSLFFRIKWWKILLILAMPLYCFGAHRNAQITAAKLEPVAAGFCDVSAECVAVLEETDGKRQIVLDCNGAYDEFIQTRDDITHSRGCWNAANWKVIKQGSDTVTSTTIDVWCALPLVF